MGWNSVYWEDGAGDDLMNCIEQGDQFYFVHSYHVCDVKKVTCIHFHAVTDMILLVGLDLERVSPRNSIQKKSQEKGLTLYRNFLEKML